jgi:hypothetical protein
MAMAVLEPDHESMTVSEEGVEATHDCDALLPGFEWKDVTEVDPSRDLPPRGVYVLRVRALGAPAGVIDERIRHALDVISWPLLASHVKRRLRRLGRIGACPVLYIGAARSNFTDTFGDFLGRNITMQLLWPLLWGKWKIDIGWKSSEDPWAERIRLLGEYRRVHGNDPALMTR